MQFDHTRWRPKRARAVIAAAAITVTWLAVAPVPASASSLDGCSGTATSLDANGEVIDAATASGGGISDTQDGRPGATASNPFVIDADGRVAARVLGQVDAKTLVGIVGDVEADS